MDFFLRLKRTFTIVMWGAMFFVGGCSPTPEGPCFARTWTIVKEDGIGGQQSKSMVVVTVKQNQFRISSKDEETETVDVYDGKNLESQKQRSAAIKR